ncbi:hypothetical protein NXC24_CH01711 [Rhizobium sp. NXC24]|nr:hypothetical protein NXC24_CH01711 [Rhizobium sp. NXC24]
MAWPIGNAELKQILMSNRLQHRHCGRFFHSTDGILKRSSGDGLIFSTSPPRPPFVFDTGTMKPFDF